MSNPVLVKSWKVQPTSAGVLLTLNGRKYNLGPSLDAIVHDLRSAPGRKTFFVTDGFGPDCEIVAESAESAARRYVTDPRTDWPCETIYGDRPTKWELKVWESSQDEDDHEWVTIETTPEELPGGTREQHYPEQVTGKPASWD